MREKKEERKKKKKKDWVSKRLIYESVARK